MKSLALSFALHIMALTLVSSIAAPGSQQTKQIPLDRVRQAMATTTQSSANITQAYEACKQWNDIMTDSDQLPENVRGICFALQASCRARVGQDMLALESYQSCLNLKQHLSLETFYDATMGKAFALQRLMKYDDAHCEFLKCDDTERACLGAVTCLLRQCDMKGAEKQLRDFVEKHPDSVEAQGMLGVLLMMQATAKNELEEAMQMLAQRCNKSPLYQWAHWMSLIQSQASLPPTRQRNTFDILELASVNQSPFDDPLLIHLDDKVLLHDLLTSTSDTSTFWPRGFVLPHDSSKIKEYLPKKKSDKTGKEWILKQRAGYGSHGNQLVSECEIMDLLDMRPDGSDSYLCQQLVSPPLLLDGYKFTMRIYVVYFPGSSSNEGAQVYLANEGLVKLASLPYDENGANDEQVHMTNSGRQDEMGQCDLMFLEKEFEKAGWSYRDLWNDIREAVSVVMRTYMNFTNEQQNDQTEAVGKLGIPKIMGFDFIVDANRRPFLLEVNRFPGLEPRDASDCSIKQAVVQGAWALAGERSGLDIIGTHRLVDLDVSPCSFGRLQ